MLGVDGEDSPGVGEGRVAEGDGTDPGARALSGSPPTVLSAPLLSSTLLDLTEHRPIRSHPSAVPSSVVAILSLSPPSSIHPPQISPTNQAVPFKTDREQESPSMSRSLQTPPGLPDLLVAARTLLATRWHGHLTVPFRIQSSPPLNYQMQPRSGFRLHFGANVLSRRATVVTVPRPSSRG